MRKSYNKNGYKAPKAEITVFECSDVITVSRTLYKMPENQDSKSYVSAGSTTWRSGLGQ